MSPLFINVHNVQLSTFNISTFIVHPPTPTSSTSDNQLSRPAERTTWPSVAFTCSEPTQPRHLSQQSTCQVAVILYCTWHMVEPALPFDISLLPCSSSRTSLIDSPQLTSSQPGHGR